jgi:hypothetical protein
MLLSSSVSTVLVCYDMLCMMESLIRMCIMKEAAESRIREVQQTIYIQAKTVLNHKVFAESLEYSELSTLLVEFIMH